MHIAARSLFATAIAVALLGMPAVAPAVEADFERHIAPLLIGRCLTCHNSNDAAGGLNLSESAAAFGEGESGEIAIVPGSAERSYLIERVAAGEMPPDGKGEPVSAAELKLLTAWIEAGASWPEGRRLSQFEQTTDQRAGFDWWSLEPVERPAVPEIDDAWVRNPIDAFILRQLRANNLRPAPEADRRTLLRRLSFDLTGLPPTIDETEAFLSDESPDAYEKLVDKLLASPRYGERWGRHWLDVAHYADTHGFERDFRRDHAWPYRDYVIRSFNDDKPYNQFLREQIAGDLIDPNDPEKIVATGFLAAGPWDFVGHRENMDPQFRRQARADDLDDMVATVMTASVGLTVNCARCHDHKFDPISLEDYYRLTAVFADVQREDRNLPAPPGLLAARGRLAEVEAKLAQYEGKPVSLTDIVGGGNGFGDGQRGHGIDVRSGKPTSKQEGFLDSVKVNEFVPAQSPLVDGVFVPSGQAAVTISSTGLEAPDMSATSGRVWDHIKYGPSLSPQTTVAGGVDYNRPPHTMLALHANKGITFDLAAIRAASEYRRLRFRGIAAYGGAAGEFSADVWVLVDGEVRLEKRGLKRDDDPLRIDIELPPESRFLTLIATDGGNDISHDQVFFGDAVLIPEDEDERQEKLDERQQAEIAALRREREALGAQRKQSSNPPDKVYAVVAQQKSAAVHVLQRGNTESPGKLVTPGALTCVRPLEANLAAGDHAQQPRRALAEWIVDTRNPLTRRVLVNRLWHYHFGQGLVNTPSDFGFLGGRPSHPELLDWLAAEFMERGWSLKEMHRLIVLSSTYRQSGRPDERGLEIDGENRLLWRRAPRRLEAEIVRDAVLASSGKLNLQMGGPGYRDFEFIDLYAPIYRYVTPDKPELWRRSVYRFAVRSVPHQFMDVLDCPNPSNLAPSRAETTTALQSLTLLNDPFMLQQAGYLAERAKREAGQSIDDQVAHVYRLVLTRRPTADELAAATRFVEEHSLFHLCRVLYNSNEFLYID